MRQAGFPVPPAFTLATDCCQHYFEHDQTWPNALEEQVRAGLMTLDDYIDRISEVLGDPQTHLRVGRVRMRLNKMNIRLDGAASAEAGHELDLTEVSLGESLRRILLITRFPRIELLPRQDFLK